MANNSTTCTTDARSARKTAMEITHRNTSSCIESPFPVLSTRTGGGRRRPLHLDGIGSASFWWSLASFPQFITTRSTYCQRVLGDRVSHLLPGRFYASAAHLDCCVSAV